MKGCSVENRIGRTSLNALIFAMLMAGAATSSCSDGSGRQAFGQEKIGPEGGTVSAPQGASVVIPPGALSEETTITVTLLTGENMDELVPDLAFFYGGADFGPDGITFEKPVTISFPVDQPMPAGSTVPLYIYDQETGSAVETEFMATVGDGGDSVSAEVTHFTPYLHIMPVSMAILAEIEKYVGDGSDPDGILTRYASWFVNEAVKPYDFWTITSDGSCYTIVGIFFDLIYHQDDVKFERQLMDAESSNLEQQLTYHNDYESLDHRLNVHFEVHLFLAVEPDLALEIQDRTLDEGDTTQVTARLTCNSKPMEGNDIAISVDQNGKVSRGSGQTDSKGELKVTFTAEDEGVATVSADHNAEHCLGTQSSFGMSDTINIGESNAWQGTATYHRLIENDCYMDEADYSVSFNFTADPTDMTLSGTATVQQDVTVEITNHANCGWIEGQTVTLENLKASETLDLIVGGFYSHFDGEFEWLWMTLSEEESVDFYDFDICSAYSDGNKTCHSASGDSLRDKLSELQFEHVPIGEGTTTGTWPCDAMLYNCATQGARGFGTWAGRFAQDRNCSGDPHEAVPLLQRKQKTIWLDEQGCSTS